MSRLTRAAMRFFINIIVAGQLIGDPEGDDFADYAEAQARALRSGRELMADWLLQDKSIPFQSFIQIADSDGGIVETLPMDRIAFGTVASRTLRLPEARHAAPVQLRVPERPKRRG